VALVIAYRRNAGERDGIIVMKLLPFFLGIAAAIVAGGAPSVAQDYPWCANFADGAGINCGFSTYQQCMATSQGSGGFCTENNMYRRSGTAGDSLRSRRRRARKSD
jgi:hypothetical protein